VLWLGTGNNLECAPENVSPLVCYNFDTCQPMLMTFGRNITEKVEYQTVDFFSLHLTNVSVLPGKTWKGENRMFQSNALLLLCQSSASCFLISSVLLTWNSIFFTNGLITLHLRCSRGEMYIGHLRLCVCVSCVSVPRRMPTLLHWPGCNFGEW